MAIVHKEQAGLVSVAEPKALWLLAVGHCHPAEKHVLGTGCSSPPAPPCKPRARWWEAAQGQGQLSPAPLGAQAAGKQSCACGRDPALGLPQSTELQLPLGGMGMISLLPLILVPTSLVKSQQSQLQKELMLTETQ